MFSFISDYPEFSLCLALPFLWLGLSFYLQHKVHKYYFEFPLFLLCILFLLFGGSLSGDHYNIGVSLAWIVLIPLVLIKRNEYISPWNHRRVGLILGLILGVVLGLVGLLVPGAQTTTGNLRNTDWVPGILFGAIQASIAEEFVFRWLLVNYLKKFELADSMVILIQGLIFGAAHWARYWDQYPLLILVTVFGLLAGWLAIKQKNIACSSIAHAVFNLIFVIRFLVP